MTLVIKDEYLNITLIGLLRFIIPGSYNSKSIFIPSLFILFFKSTTGQNYWPFFPQFLATSYVQVIEFWPSRKDQQVSGKQQERFIFLSYYNIAILFFLHIIKGKRGVEALICLYKQSWSLRRHLQKVLQLKELIWQGYLRKWSIVFKLCLTLDMVREVKNKPIFNSAILISCLLYMQWTGLLNIANIIRSLCFEFFNIMWNFLWVEF